MSDNAAFNTLGPREFLRRYPVNDIREDTDLTAIRRPGEPQPPPAPGPALPPRTKGGEVIVGNLASTRLGGGQSSVQKLHRVRYLTFRQRVEANAQVTSSYCPFPTQIQISPNANGIPAFFLPYQNDFNYRITLNAAGPGAANVDFFLTPPVDGCSVYVEGTAQTPTVYHINAANYADKSNRPTSFENLAAAAGQNLATMDAIQKHNLQFMFKSMKMDERFNFDAGHRPKTVTQQVAGLRPARKLENDDYMLVQDTPEWKQFQDSLPTLQANHIAPVLVGGKTVDRMSCVLTQGIVFGVRTGGDWAFYVQRKALVEYFQLTTKATARLGAYLQRKDRPLLSLGMQWIVRDVVQFWPAAGAGSNV